jgi:flagellar L-ring protein FlgH
MMIRTLMVASLALAGCGKLQQVGRAPEFSGLEGTDQHFAMYSAALPDDVPPEPARRAPR